MLARQIGSLLRQRSLLLTPSVVSTDYLLTCSSTWDGTEGAIKRYVHSTSVCGLASHPLQLPCQSHFPVRGVHTETTSSAHEATPPHPSPNSAESKEGTTLSFRDHQTIFRDASTFELLRAWVVFRMCGVPAFVRHADSLLRMSNRILGIGITTFIVKHTFFNHFCAGETPDEVWHRMKRLQIRGVSAILDYAAEDDIGNRPMQQVHPDQMQQQDLQQASLVTGPNAPDRRKAVARVYCYQSELQCDRHVTTFLNAIDTASNLPGQGFAAVKVTALGNPELLERVSNAICTVRGLFERFDADGSGYIDQAEFLAAHKQVFPDASAEDAARAYLHYDPQGEGKVDYVAWCQRLSLSQMPIIAESIHRAYGDKEEMRGWLGDLSSSCLTQEEYDLVVSMKERLERIVERAVTKDVKLMIDAEHTYFQPAIDHLTLRLMKKYNVGGKAYIYNTYQAYLTSCEKRLADDMERAKRSGCRFACKLVRGAYLNLERSRAKARGYPSPCWGSLEETHAAYERCLRMLMENVVQGRAEVLLGTHNEHSIQLAVELMSQSGLQPGQSPVYFGQLLGMADHLTFTLGMNKYPAFKYVPYGMVREVIPYLLRRAQENASILSGAKADIQLLEAEISRRSGWNRVKAKLTRQPVAA